MFLDTDVLLFTLQSASYKMSRRKYRIKT